jgi:hypothetical protein
VLRNLLRLMDEMPVWAQLVVAALLVLYAVASVYGRIDTRFGSKIFSRIPERELRTNMGHIFQYTVMPVIVCLGFLFVLIARHS